jgi:hypothetical protein
VVLKVRGGGISLTMVTGEDQRQVAMRQGSGWPTGGAEGGGLSGGGGAVGSEEEEAHQKKETGHALPLSHDGSRYRVTHFLLRYVIIFNLP